MGQFARGASCEADRQCSLARGHGAWTNTKPESVFEPTGNFSHENPAREWDAPGYALVAHSPVYKESAKHTSRGRQRNGAGDTEPKSIAPANGTHVLFIFRDLGVDILEHLESSSVKAITKEHGRALPGQN